MPLEVPFDIKCWLSLPGGSGLVISIFKRICLAYSTNVFWVSFHRRISYSLCEGKNENIYLWKNKLKIQYLATSQQKAWLDINYVNLGRYLCNETNQQRAINDEASRNYTHTYVMCAHYNGNVHKCVYWYYVLMYCILLEICRVLVHSLC